MMKVENTSFQIEEERDGNLFVTQNAIQAILSWKAHQIRVVHQDEYRLQVIEKLSENTGLIVQDFAMKFLPAEYREAQSDFFGKRGISWHISVRKRKKNLNLKHLNIFLNQDFKIALLWCLSWSLF